MNAKRKRVSKKTKKSWRKNVDISDVDNFMQDQLLQERLGVKHSDEKDEDLFEIDTKGGNVKDVVEKSKGKDETQNESSDNIIYETLKFSMRLKETKTPKCFELLEKRSAVPVPLKISKRVKLNAAKEMTLQRKLAAKQKKLISRAANSMTKTEKKQVKTNPFTYDVWNKKEEKDFNSEWLSTETIRHNLQNTGQHKKKIPKTVLSKSSLLPAVEAPHPGLSYNPSLKDHQDVLMKVAEKELENIKEEEHLNRVTNKMFSKVSRDQIEKDWIAEMSVGLTAAKGDSNDEDDDGQDYKALNPPVKNKKKTLQKRRKLREAMELKEKLKKQKLEKKKLSDIYKLRLFNESLNKRENKIMKNMEKKKMKKLQKPFKTKALSQIKYVEPEIDFQLGEELSGNLRNVKPEGNLLLERYKSLQKRNVLQPTVKRKGTKPKVKQYERENTKMDWELQKGQSMTKMKKRFKK